MVSVRASVWAGGYPTGIRDPVSVSAADPFHYGTFLLHLHSLPGETHTILWSYGSVSGGGLWEKVWELKSRNNSWTSKWSWSRQLEIYFGVWGEKSGWEIYKFRRLVDGILSHWTGWNTWRMSRKKTRLLCWTLEHFRIWSQGNRASEGMEKEPPERTGGNEVDRRCPESEEKVFGGRGWLCQGLQMR